MQTQATKSKNINNLAVLKALENNDEVCSITFPSGIYGFPESKSFALTPLKNPKYESFMLLLNMEEPGLTFLLFPIYKQGEALFDKDEIKSLSEEIDVAENGYDLFAIASLQNVSEEAIDYTLNIQAPVVLDTDRKIAWQQIINGKEFTTNYQL